MNNISREKALELIGEVRSFVEKMDLAKCFDKNALSNIIEHSDLEMDFQGVSNGFLSEIVHAVTGYDIEVIGEVDVLFSCPCCGYKTLTELHDTIKGTGYDICPYCRWEDDGTVDINSYRAINQGSIQDYRYKICTNPNKYYISKWFK